MRRWIVRPPRFQMGPPQWTAGQSEPARQIKTGLERCASACHAAPSAVKQRLPS